MDEHEDHRISIRSDYHLEPLGRVHSRRCVCTDGVDLPIFHERPDKHPPGCGKLVISRIKA